MSKKLMKILSMSLVLIFAIAIFATPVKAEGKIPEVNYTKIGDTTKPLTDVGAMILGIATTIGMIVAVVILVVLAIKYMASSPNDKAEIKKHAIVWVVGAVLLFAASGVVKLVQGFGNEVGSTLNTASADSIVKDINA